jgi:hypothetical protein
MQESPFHFVGQFAVRSDAQPATDLLRGSERTQRHRYHETERRFSSATAISGFRMSTSTVTRPQPIGRGPPSSSSSTGRKTPSSSSTSGERARFPHQYNYHAQFFWNGKNTDGVRILHFAGEKPLEKPELPRMKVWFEEREEMEQKK